MNDFIKKFILIGIGIIIIGFLFFWFITKPAVASYNKHKLESSEKKSELITNQKKLSILKKSRSTESNLGKVLKEVSVLWPETTEISRFMVQTEELAKSKNFVMDNFSISETTIKKNDKEPEDTTITNYSFNTAASFPTIVEIIKSMERLERYNSISRIDLSVKENDLLNLTLNGRLYYGK